jgi:hypothetical protein
MKCYLLFFALLGCIAGNSQTAITAVTTSTAPAASDSTYTDDGNTYNWGLAPNNTETHVTGFTAGVPFTYVSSLDGTVKLRRVDNANTTGLMTLVWVETVTSDPTTFNMLPEYKNDMEAFLDNNIYNEGADNLLDNTAPNSNNIERFDWILPGGFSTAFPAQAGFPVFERGNAGAHDAFAIAAITSLDGSNNPASYSNIVRVTAANYGDPGPNVTYRVLKAVFPANLLDLAVNTSQGRGGVFISLQDLGIAADVPIFGYSLFGNDLPVTATPADLVDWTNTTFFPTNTPAASGGIELLATTGIAATATVLPTRFISFDAVENGGIVNLKWSVENETAVNRYEIERSTDGVNFYKVNEVKSIGSHNYTLPDNITSVLSDQVYYRIKQYDQSGYYYFSKTLAIKLNIKPSSMILYPNPAIRSLYVNFISVANDKGVISVTNSLGAQVISQHVQLIKGNNSFTVDGVNALPRGAYQLSLKLTSGATLVKQFSKQ